MSNKKYRVVTFQSEEVFQQLCKSEEYYADKDRMREGSINDTDINICGGKVPIWVFQHPAFKTDKISIKQMYLRNS